MNGPSPPFPSERPSRSQISDEIGRAVGTLWQRRFGVRPASVKTEYVGDIVRCTIERGDESQSDEETGAPVDAEAVPTCHYEQEAQASVKRLTGRPVTGFIAKAPSDGLATNAFILERALTKH